MRLVATKTIAATDKVHQWSCTAIAPVTFKLPRSPRHRLSTMLSTSFTTIRPACPVAWDFKRSEHITDAVGGNCVWNENPNPPIRSTTLWTLKSHSCKDHEIEYCIISAIHAVGTTHSLSPRIHTFDGPRSDQFWSIDSCDVTQSHVVLGQFLILSSGWKCGVHNSLW